MGSYSAFSMARAQDLQTHAIARRPTANAPANTMPRMSAQPNMPARTPTPPLTRDAALFLDIDGCLIAFAETPDGVHVPDSLREVLARVSVRLDGALALVSGRVVESIDALFAPLRLHASGQHGLERRGPLGTARAQVQATRDAAFDAVLDEARTLLARHPGALLEDKPLGFALHWRAAPAAGPELHAFADAAVARLPAFALQPGDHVVELKPRGIGKGDAIAAFLAEPPFEGRTPVFLGDDLTDEHGFAEVNARGGVSVLVGPRHDSAARHHLADPAAVAAWLSDFLAAQDTA